uniref:Pro-MCH n=1 Tax=Theropithecus gelada TaxID=9565 RepID=A0A8D2GC57_THEGE
MLSSKCNFLNHGLPLNVAIKPYLVLKGSVAFPVENGVQNTESTWEKREIEDEENSATFPIGRGDFDNEQSRKEDIYRHTKAKVLYHQQIFLISNHLFVNAYN